MITYVRGDLFESPAKVLVNTVNTVGVMGKGIAKTFKELFPEMFEQYQHYCETKQLTIGKLWLYKTPNKWVLNFPTKTTWRKPSSTEYVEAGLKAFRNSFQERGIQSIAFPPLGCGNGELNWETQVRPLMERYLGDLPINVFVYIYDKSIATDPEHKSIEEMKRWIRSSPKSMSFDEVWQDLGQLSNSDIFKQWTDAFDGLKYKLKIIDEQGIQVAGENSNHSSILPRNDLAEVWLTIRKYGFISKENFPSSLSNYYGVILNIFGELPYVKTVALNADYSALKDDERSLGLQLLPDSSRSNAREAEPVRVKIG